MHPPKKENGPEPFQVTRPGVPASNPAAPGPQVPAYVLAECAVPQGLEPHLTPIAQMAHITRAIVETEGPIHRDEVARRVTSLFGKSRTGSLIGAASLKSLLVLKSSSALFEEDGFWMTPSQLVDPSVRDRSSAPISLQRADTLSPREIRAAAKIAIRENGDLSDGEMVVAVTRLLGFKRTGPELSAVIAKALLEYNERP